MIFIDYQNVHGWARRRFHPPDVHPSTGHVHPLELANVLIGKRRRASRLEAVRVYRGRPSPDHQPNAAAANERQAIAWQRGPEVTVIRRPLRYPPDWPVTPAAEKGIDVAIAIDLVRLAMIDAYDAAILVSSDTDLMPALETIYGLRLGHVEVATWAGLGRLRFPGTKLPWCHYVTEAEYRSVADLTDYTKG